MGKIKKKYELKNKTSVGGQAVIEGVMMRGKTAQATAVRDGDGNIRLETKRLKPPSERSAVLRLPVIRGCVAFFDSLIGGTKTLTRSAEVFGEGEPSKFEKWVSEKFKIDVMNVIVGFSLILGVALALFLFLFLPIKARELLELIFATNFSVIARNFIEGGFKLLIFIFYIVFCSLFKDVRRTFMYHGAEHKTISCYEKGLDLTVANAKKCSRIHDRCGTTFMVFVMLISIIVFAVFESFVNFYSFITNVNLAKLLRFVCKLAFIPVVAGLSYELLKFLAKTSSPIFLPLKLPGMALQKITTKEPDDDMLEVAITAFKKVMEMDADLSIPMQDFAIPITRKQLTEKIADTLKKNGITEEAEAEWIVSLSVGVKRCEARTSDVVPQEVVDKTDKIVKDRITGRPLWYCIGDTDFYGFKILTDERALIPRPETELLVENALKNISADSSVLDLCTGSGCIAIAVAKKSGVKVCATDISDEALSLATENARINGADAEFIKSDMFSSLGNRKFDVIISNPPYIRSDDLKTLQREVKDFEPTIALDGGADGLDFYRIISAQAGKYLNKNGVIIVECGIGEAEAIKGMFEPFSSVEIIKDYEGIDRIVKAVLND